MFTLTGAAIGVLISVITIATNYIALSTLTGSTLLLVYMIIFASFMSFGSFVGIVIDLVIEKLKK